FLPGKDSFIMNLFFGGYAWAYLPKSIIIAALFVEL
ncbi:unnamed protein product, partial [marine sediment metagenome]